MKKQLFCCLVGISLLLLIFLCYIYQDFNTPILTPKQETAFANESDVFWSNDFHISAIEDLKDINASTLAPQKKTAFANESVVFWSNDFHISPIADLKDLLKPLGVRFVDKSLSGHCHLTNTCANNLRVINKSNGINLDPMLIPGFYKSYINDTEMTSVDAFVCFHPSSMCELFMPFNKSLLVIASTRYEMGRWNAIRWRQWNTNLLLIAGQSYNVVGANNLYDAKYIEYFTGIRPVLLPSFCGYVHDKYNATKKKFILASRSRPGPGQTFLDQYRAACKKGNVTCPVISPLRELYKHYKYSDLASHPGIVHIPYQVSVMSLFEQYRMNIPLFFPTLDLLTDWQYKHHVMNERTWDMVHGKTPSNSTIPPHESQADIPDPNCETDPVAIRHWIQYADFYNMPHITLYNSAEDLIDKLNGANLTNISARMKLANEKAKTNLLAKWTDILNKIRRKVKS